jgi:hypothetical protein
MGNILSGTEVAKMPLSGLNQQIQLSQLKPRGQGKKCGCKPVLVVDDNEFNLYTFS